MYSLALYIGLIINSPCFQIATAQQYILENCTDYPETVKFDTIEYKQPYIIKLSYHTQDNYGNMCCKTTTVDLIKNGNY